MERSGMIPQLRVILSGARRSKLTDEVARLSLFTEIFIFPLQQPHPPQAVPLPQAWGRLWRGAATTRGFFDFTSGPGQPLLRFAQFTFSANWFRSE